jgi:Zn-finger nucleic acid-binding protein
MAADARGLHCPNCGSPAAAGDARCSYCHAELATVSCPSCFALIFKGAAYCPHCGNRTERAAGAQTTERCPGCHEPMREVRVGVNDLRECAACGGLWVDAAAFERICADGEARAAVLARWPAREATTTSATVRYRPCVVCRKMMNRLNFGRMSGTVIDVCRGHGTFLDAGELHQIAEFIHSGGLERSRQRQLDELKEAEARLLARERDQAMRDVRTGAGSGIKFEWKTTRLEGADAIDVLRRLLKEDKS